MTLKIILKVRWTTINRVLCSRGKQQKSWVQSSPLQSAQALKLATLSGWLPNVWNPKENSSRRPESFTIDCKTWLTTTKFLRGCWWHQCHPLPLSSLQQVWFIIGTCLITLKKQPWILILLVQIFMPPFIPCVNSAQITFPPAESLGVSRGHKSSYCHMLCGEQNTSGQKTPGPLWGVRSGLATGDPEEDKAVGRLQDQKVLSCEPLVGNSGQCSIFKGERGGG